MKTQNIHAIVLGASGAIGAELLDCLINDNRFTHIQIITRRKLNIDNKKVTQIIVDFDNLDQCAERIQGDVLFSTLGTTIKAAGTKANQYTVDFTYQYNIAKIAKQNDVKNYVLISSAGANHNSRTFYLRMKGELDEAIKNLGFRKTSILKPSVLIRTKGEFRKGENTAINIVKFMNSLGIFRSYKPVQTVDVAKAMIYCALNNDFYSELRLKQIEETSRKY